MEKKEKVKFSDAMKYLGKNKYKYLLSVIIDNLIIVICFNFVIAIIMKNLFNAVTTQSYDLFIEAIYITVSCTIFAIIVQPIARFIKQKIVKATIRDMKLKVFNHIQKLPMNYFENNHTGNTISRVTNDIKIIESLYMTHIDSLFFTVFIGVGAFLMMLYLEWRLALSLIAISSITALINNYVLKKLRKFNDNIQNSKGIKNERILDIIEGFNTIKLFQIESKIFKKFNNVNEEVVNEEIKKSKISAGLSMINNLFDSIRTIGLIVIGIIMFMYKQLDLGTLIAVFQLQGNMNSMFTDLGQVVIQIENSMAGLRRVDEILSIPVEEELEIKEEQSNLNDTEEAIRIEDVNFKYDKDKNALSDINLSIKKGEMVALVGESGSGKSTIFKLLLGFYKKQSGKILIGGKKIEEFSLKELRSLISYVPQMPFLFNATIRENIMYGNFENSTDASIEQAADIANASIFIEKFECKYENQVGEKGELLSTGQRQRIAIARAINKNADIILLDEPTSSVDNQSEYLIQKALKKIGQNKTILISTHRLSILRKVDKIIVMDKGRIIEYGDHDKLMKENGKYKELYMKISYENILKQ